MSYLANSARLASLTIGGVDYSASLSSWTASDNTAYKNGCIVTTGQLVLGRQVGSSDIEDYDRNTFRRGSPVILQITYPDGTTQRHPRGLLYVISNSYDLETDTIEVELGCRLALMNLTDEVDDLIAISPLTLDTAQRTFSNVSAAFASVGQVCYQDNQGVLQTRTFFDGDTFSSTAAGEWVAIAGVTSTSVSPLAGAAAIPDRINIQYQVPSSTIATDNTGFVETVIDESKYWSPYPAIQYVRVLPASSTTDEATLFNALRQATDGREQSASRTSSDSCGNTPSAPSGPGQNNARPFPVYASCNDQFELRKEQQYIPVTRTQTTSTYYDAPGGQVSRIYSEIRGSAVEANSQYFADKYAYCRSVYASACNPNGSCPMEGLEEILLGYTETINYYGDANELVKTVQDTYATTLSAASPNDWRSGNANGVPQNFNQSLSTTELYRASRVITEYFKQSNANVQTTKTFTSTVSRGTGITEGLDTIDALNGIVTTTKRTSTTTATLDISPDRVNSATTDTKEQSTEVILFQSRYIEPPNESGPYILEESIPMPLLYETQAEIDSTVEAYSNYISRFVKGDSFGQQIGENLRKDICDGWYVGRPFRYYDPSNDELLAMRMDACTWGVDQNGAAVVTNGIWIGKSNGTLTLPNNLVGNSAPDLSVGTGVGQDLGEGGIGGSPAAPPATNPPVVNNETNVDNGAFIFQVNVYFGTGVVLTPNGDADGVTLIPPSDLTTKVSMGFTSFVAGLVVEPGDLLDGDGNGGIPIEYNGNLVVANAVVVDEDLFAPAP